MPFTRRPAFNWQLRNRTIALGEQTKIMGILNVTPDSFSDGGQFDSIDKAIDQALTMLDEGAHILDIGGESTRPNAIPLSPEEEQQRVIPVIEAILKERPDVILSIDTFHAVTAQRAVEAGAGAEIVNDVSGLTWDSAMPDTCATLNCGVILMHTRGRPNEWPLLRPIPPPDIMPIVIAGLRNSISAARSAGISNDRIVLDPGFGFGKIGNENYTVLAHLHELHQLGLPILSGASRKGFLARTLAPFYDETPAPIDKRVVATTAANVASILAGAHILRVHDVRAAVESAAIADEILAATPELS